MNSLDKLILLEKKAKDFGFDWPHTHMILDQIISECAEIKESIDHNEGQNRLQEEIGDLLHAAVSLVVFNGFDVSDTLGRVNVKFESRINHMIALAKEQGLMSFHGQSFDWMLDLWAKAKVKDCQER